MADEENNKETVPDVEVDLNDEEDPVDDKPAPSSPTTGGLTTPTEVVAASKAWFAEAKGFAYVELCSLVLMFSCIAEFQKGSNGLLVYALIVAVFSLAACLGIQTAEYMKPGFLEKNEKFV